MNACVDEVAKHYAKCRNTSLDPLRIPHVLEPTSLPVWRQQELHTYNAEWARFPQVVKKIFSVIPTIFTFIFFLVSDSLWHICQHYCYTFESLLIYSYVILTWLVGTLENNTLYIIFFLRVSTSTRGSIHSVRRIVQYLTVWRISCYYAAWNWYFALYVTEKSE